METTPKQSKHADDDIVFSNMDASTKQSEELSEKDKDDIRKSTTHSLLLAGFILLVTVSALTIGIVLHFELNDDDDDAVARTTLLVDCFPELRRDSEKMESNKEACRDRGCEWQMISDDGVPWCTYPGDYGYKLHTQPTMTSDNTYRVELSHDDSPAMFGDRSQAWRDVVVDVEMQTDNRLRVKMSPKNAKKWEIPVEALNIEASNDARTDVNSSKFTVDFTSEPVFGIIVKRKDTGYVVFNSSTPGTVLSDQFLQLTNRLTNEKLYGFGEHRHQKYQLDMHWRRWSMFTRDAGPTSDWNLYGQHPVYMNIEDDGKANMVLLKNSNAMEVLLQPSPEAAVTYKVIGGVLDFYIFLGDSPHDVIKEYIKAIGRPVFPPYWSMGYHLSRWGYTNITDMKTVVDRTIQAGIPYESQWADIDTFHKAYVFTYDKETWPDFPALVTSLKKQHRHFVTIVDPGIGANETIVEEIQRDFQGYDMLQSGLDLDIFVKAADNSTLIGEVWPGITTYPDFTNPNSQDWWTTWIRYYRDTVGVDVEALWIDMNEPANFVPGSTSGCERNDLNYPPFVPDILGSSEDGRMFDKTLCMDARQHWGVHYNVHSLYAHSMAMKTFGSLQTIFPNLRPWTMTRSSFVGTGQFATKWQGDNQATWADLRTSIIHLLEFGMFGFSMTGADICGFWLEPSEELCLRWHQLGAFYPFARNHNGKGDDPVVFRHQDPASWGAAFVDRVRPALVTRQKFLPYLYTLLHKAHTDGDLVARALLVEFPMDPKTHTIDEQFMLGPAFLISPVLYEGATTVDAYFPKGLWFEYFSGKKIESSGQWIKLDTPLNTFNLHVREGHIVPWQEPAATTYESRQNDFGILVALTTAGKASGDLFWDDGVSNVIPANSVNVRFNMTKMGELTIRSEGTGQFGHLRLSTLEIYGLTRLPGHFYVGDLKVPEGGVLVYQDVVRVSVNVNMTEAETVITWSDY